ncbi:MAG: MFS transporter [Cytophagales bacterium]|nr:MFS transporter [Armatimonadota bacterium]
MPSSFLTSRFQALQSPDFRSLWFGQIVSAAGSMMQFAALNWQIYELTRSPVALGMVGLVRVIPIILFSLLGGAVADAHDRRRLLLMTQTTLALVALALGFLSITGRTSLWAIYALTAIGAAAVSFDNPARQALLPSLVPREHLPNAFALNSTGFQIATIAGPALAGLVIKHYEVGGAYFINAGSFLAVIGALLTLRYRPAPRAEDDPSAVPAVSIAALKEGIAFVLGTPILTATMLIDFVATFFSSASALLPIFAKEILHVGPDGYGLLASFPAFGSLLAGMIVTFLPPVSRQGRVLIWAVMAYGLVTIGFGFANIFAISALFLAATGAADTVSTILRQTIRQTITPDRLRGRMVAINMIFFMGGPQLGELEAGIAARLFGPVFAVVSGGVGSVIAAALIAARAPWLYRFRLADWRAVQEKPSK